MISIIVTFYNSERYIKQCLNSIVNQIYQDYEVIMVNDGSTDNSRAIALTYLDDSRFKLIDIEHVGYPQACNIGVSNAKGDYIIFLDSDDIADANWLHCLYQAIIKYDCDISMCTSSKFNEDNEDSITPVDIKKLDSDIVDITHDKMCYLFDSRVLGCIWNKLVKRELYDYVTFPKDVPAQSDIFGSCILLDKANKVSYIDYQLINYRKHADSRMAKAGHGNDYWTYRINLFIDLMKPILEKYPYTRFICRRYMRRMFVRIRNDNLVTDNFYNELLESKKEELDKLFNLSYDCDFDVDLVVPFVDSRDKVWQEAYTKTFGNETYNNNARFDNPDLFEYCIKGVDKYMPWIRKIHLIVSNIEQVPEYINKDKTHIVLHKDIIPEEYLPTFNSQTIEMFIHNIEGLSEHFIYSNDDIYPISETNKSDFFSQDGKPKIIFKRRFLNEKITFYERVCSGNYRDVLSALGMPYREDSYLKTEHSMTPMILSHCKECFNKMWNYIKVDLGPARTDKQHNQHIYSLYERFTKNYVYDSPMFTYYDLKDEVSVMASTIENQDCQLLCLNGTSDAAISKEHIEEIVSLLKENLGL